VSWGGLYNMMHGVSPLTAFAIPLLGDKRPEEYPRFRDVFASDPEHPEYDQGRGDAYYIHLYTRVGGNNRGCGEGETELYDHPQYVATFDDRSDTTYGTYVFRVPAEWIDDWRAVLEGRFSDTSPDYRRKVETMFPTLVAKKWFPWHETT